MNNNDLDFWFWLETVANFCQIESYEMLKKEASNDQIMLHLDKQDQKYLQKIIDQNEEIIRLLKGGAYNEYKS